MVSIKFVLRLGVDVTFIHKTKVASEDSWWGDGSGNCRVAERALGPRIPPTGWEGARPLPTQMTCGQLWVTLPHLTLISLFTK